MKNLHLSRCQSLHNPLLDGSSLFHFDSASSTAYFVSDRGLIKYSHQSKEFSVIVSEEKFAPHINDNIGKEVISLLYMSFEQSICIITSYGRFLQATVGISDDSAIENIGTISSGIEACSWSPDQELLVVITGNDTVLLLTSLFQVLVEAPLEKYEEGEIQQVSVGWGSKETQFHGSEGKAAATVVAEKPVSLFKWDDRKPIICWRGDGELFVISLTGNERNFRHLRIYNREAILQCISENTVGLENVLHWKPAGNLIGCSQQYQNKHKIIFFEKNGLQHGEFVLPYSPGKVSVKDLMWNADSSIIAILYQPIDEPKDKKRVSWIELWTVSNYHWYLKQTLNFEVVVRKLLWDCEEPFNLNVLLSNSKFVLYKFHFGVDCCSWTSSLNQGLVPVIDGEKVCLSPFRIGIVPPPMSSEVIQMDRPVNQVFFQHCSNNLGVATSDGDFHLYCYIPKEPKNGTCKLNSHYYKLISCISNPNAEVNVVGNWTWLSETDFTFTFCNGTQSFLQCFTLCNSEKEVHFDKKSEIVLEGEIESVQKCISSPLLLIQFSDGIMVQYNSENDKVYPFLDRNGQAVKFQTPCRSIQAVNINGSDVIIGLNRYFQLFCNNNELTRDCTSFGVSDEFLILTTQRHLLKCISLKNIEKKDVKTSLQTVNCREIERGATLVISIPFDTKVILQMPRGNLEMIHPRSLLLSVISQNLNELNFKAAFDIMRKHRINMNLLYDHHPENFLEHTSDLIQQLNDPASLCLLISELEEKDVCDTMYNNYCIYNNKSDQSEVKNKVDSICDTLRNKMEEINYDKFILPILSCHIKKSTSEVELALRKIQKMHDSGKFSLASDCLRHLLYIVDVNSLYEHALGMYDFAIVMMVAEKSQKDPKEYLPFLNDLQNLELNYRCFKIDSYLKRHDKALVHLSKCKGKIDEFMVYMKQHGLYVTALKCFPAGSDEYTKITMYYASYLKDKRLYDDAAIWYLRAEIYDDAITCFLEVNKWRTALATAYKAGYKQDQILKLCNQVVANLKNSHKYLEAANLLEYYLKDIEECLVLLLNGQEWEAALTIVHKYNRPDLIETNLCPSVVGSANLIIGNVKHLRETFDTHHKRLKIVREQKKEKAELADDPDFNDVDADLYSDISSVRSEASFSSGRLSQRSRVSSKSRKKIEKKKYSLKEGSMYEEEALLVALSEILQQGYDLREQIKGQTTILCIVGHEKTAKLLQNDVDSFFHHLEWETPNIWPNKKSENTHYGDGSTANSIIHNANNLTNRPDIDLHMLRQMLPPKKPELKWKLSFLSGKV